MNTDFGDRPRKRGVLFGHVAHEVQKLFPVLAQHSEYRADSPYILGHAYFLLSDQYKTKRIPPGSLTDDYKKAALSAITVMAIRPFSPLDPDNIRRHDVLLANPIMAVWSANAWLSDRDLLSHFGFDYLKRFYSSLLNVRIQSLQPFIDAVNEGEDFQEIKSIALASADVHVIDDWVLKFKMLREMKR
jgi:hypothetical protein